VGAKLWLLMRGTVRIDKSFPILLFKTSVWLPKGIFKDYRMKMLSHKEGQRDKLHHRCAKQGNCHGFTRLLKSCKSIHNIQKTLGNLAMQRLIKISNYPNKDRLTQLSDMCMRKVDRNVAHAPSALQYSNDKNYLEKNELNDTKTKNSHKILQKRNEKSDVSALVHDVLDTSGQSLDSATKDSFEPSFARDLSHVRVYTGAIAEDTS
jgi:hypothetical protein